MHSYGLNTTVNTHTQHSHMHMHNQLNPFTPLSTKPKTNNYYNNRRKDIKHLFSPHAKPHTHKSTPKLSSLNSSEECSQKKKQFQLNMNKDHLHSSSTKQITHHEEDNNTTLKKANELFQKEHKCNKEEIQNKEDDDIYTKQLEEVKSEMKKCEIHNESLSKEVARYKKQIQKLIEDNIKLKRINQEQSIIINKSNAFDTHNKFTITNEIEFAFTPCNKHNQLLINNRATSVSGTDELFSTLEQDNFALSEQLLTLESQIELYMKSKAQFNEDYASSSYNLRYHNKDNNNNNTDRSHGNNYSLNENEICSLLYAFYYKISSLLCKPIIEFDMISMNKKTFILSTSSMLTEIQAYKTFLHKSSLSSHNTNNN